MISRLSPERRHQENSSICTTGTSSVRRVLQLRNLDGPPDRLDHGNQPLRHDREVNLLDPHNRDIDHRVLQLRNLYGLPRRDHGELSMRHEREDDDLRGTATAEFPVSPEIPALHMPLQLSFWTITAMMQSIMGLRTREASTARGHQQYQPCTCHDQYAHNCPSGPKRHDAEHHGPANQGNEHCARCIATSKTSLVHATATDLQVHTGHDAEHQGPANEEGEHSAECKVTSNTSHVHATATVLVVHIGEDAEYHGPANQGREYSARCIITINTSHEDATATVHLVHNGQDAGHLGPVDNQRRH